MKVDQATVGAVEFLTALWTPTPPGLILTWELASKHSRYLRSPAGAAAIPPGSPDTYTGVGLAHEDHGKHRRTPNEKVIAIPGLWADIDVNGGPDNKQGAAPDRETAVELANSLQEPTMLVDSGYGIQAWWLFEEPWRFGTYGEQRLAAQRVAQWQKLLRERADFGLDYTHDLARVLRLPGTSNGKGGERRPVSVIATGPRHERDELLESAAAAGDVDPGYRIGEGTHHADVSCRPDIGGAGLPALDGLLASSPRFRRTWNHEREDLPSMSEHDMALASIAALAGWSDQGIADLVCVHRHLHDPEDPKGQRVDYVRRTVQRARQQEPAEAPAKPAERSSGKPATTFGPEEWADLIITRLQEDDDHAIALPFQHLTNVMDGGFRPGETCLVGGFTSSGKSAWLDQMADAAASQGRRVHLYLTEMTAYARGLRLLARRARVPFAQLRRRELDEHWPAIMAELTKLPYGCSVVNTWNVEDVIGHVIENRWDIAFVDLIHGFHYTDERDLSRTSTAIMNASKAAAGPDFPGTTVVCAAHLNDGQMRDQRSAKLPKPGLHSIKGASSLRQDTDLVMFVWRETNEMGMHEPEGMIWLAKNRDGALGGVAVSLDPGRMEFVERDARLEAVA